MHYIAEYGLFLAKLITLVIAILALVIGIIAIASKSKEKMRDKFEVKKLNDKFKEMKHILSHHILSEEDYKKLLKSEKEEEKKEEKEDKSPARKRIFLVGFEGDIRAAAVKHLRQEITAILTVATPQDEVAICLESAGGLVHAYGLAASQLARVRKRGIPLTVMVDKAAASGGYMMACVANKIIAAPFAVIGSIGVLAQIPNFHRLLEKHDIDFEQITAGEYKRTLTLFGKNTPKGREKFKEEIEDAHNLFKNFIVEYRPKVNIEKVATGEHWYGTEALNLNLIDQLMTSDDYLLTASDNADIYKVEFVVKKNISEKISFLANAVFNKLFQNWQQKDREASLL